MSNLDFIAIGKRIREQRLYLGYTREKLAEKIGITPKFCSDIELGQKGMSLQTLCNFSVVLQLSTDYILFGNGTEENASPISNMLQECPPEKIKYAEELLKIFLLAAHET